MQSRTSAEMVLFITGSQIIETENIDQKGDGRWGMHPSVMIELCLLVHWAPQGVPLPLLGLSWETEGTFGLS